MLLKTTFCLLLGGLTLAAAEQTWTGQISDAMCGADHSGMGKNISAHDCTLMCVKSGSKFVLMSNGKMYSISNQNLPALPEHAGQKVKVTGNLSSDGKTVTVSQIQGAS